MRVLSEKFGQLFGSLEDCCQVRSS
jgi:hypothetical protein